MKKRLRKKKRVGEFRELGFAVRATFRAALSDAEAIAFLRRWVGAIEARGLVFGGGNTTESFEGFVTLAKRGSASDADREALTAFFAADPVVAKHEVDALVDAWH